jgi:hypothetical protein
MSEFEVRLRAWLKNQGFDCNVVFDADFGYNWKENVLHVGTLAYPTVGRWFEQFLYEYGLEWFGIIDPVLALIHELGHYVTNTLFCEEEICSFQVIKWIGQDDRMDEQAAMFRYWEITDEFEANMWAVDFINWNIEAVEELITIYYESWETVWNKERN